MGDPPPRPQTRSCRQARPFVRSWFQAQPFVQALGLSGEPRPHRKALRWQMAKLKAGRSNIQKGRAERGVRETKPRKPLVLSRSFGD
jgi:hypothetical protein